MRKRICFIASLVFLIVLFVLFTQPTHYRVLAASNPNSTSSTTTFTIRAGNANDTFDTNGKAILKPHQQQGYNVTTLDASLNGRTAELPVGTFIFLHFPKGSHDTTINPAKGIVEYPGGRYNLPKGDMGIYKVVGQGTATITVTERLSLIDLTTNSASTTSGNWAGFEHLGSNGSYTDVTANWTVPTASGCTGSFTNTSDWVGIDGANNSNLIQTGTESQCPSGSSTPTYDAWWEILPASETVTSCTIHAGDSMFAEVKKNATNWTITIKDLSTGANCSPANQSYSGQQSSIEWIAEDPSYSGGGLEPLTNYGTVSFLNDTQNGANPQLNYSTDSVDMVQGGTVVSSTSQPNPNTNGFSVAYGSTAPSAPTTSWTNEGNMSNGQSSQQSVLLPDGKVLIAGGQQSSGDSNTKHTQIFTDGTPGSWAAKADMNAARNNFILQPVTISGGGSRVLAAGGVNSSVTNTAELYNESANTWTSTPNMNAARFKHASSILSDGRVLVTGGSNNANETTQFTSTEIYDPVANTWTTKASMNTAREEHLQVTFTDSNGNSKVMVIGGYKYGTGVLKSTEIYDPSTDTWSAGPDMAYTRDWTYNPTNALLLHDGRILVVGGDYTNDSEVYNPSTNTWTTYATPLSAWGGVATLLGSGANYNVLYAGSFDTSNFKKAMLFNPSTNSWSVTYSMNTARGAFTLVTLTSGNVVAAGGQNSTSNEINNTEEYTP